MCETRKWNKINIRAETLNGDIIALKLIGVRSNDSLIIQVPIVFNSGDKHVKSDVLIPELALRIISAVHKLESYRNCKCTSFARCENHEEEKRT